MTESRQVREAAQQVILIAIEDPEFATMRVTSRFMAFSNFERVDVAHIPVDVVSYCKWLEGKGKTQ